MHGLFIAAAGMALVTVVGADLCDLGAANIMGNFYCQPVDTIQYQNFAGTGSYNRVTNMDSDTGSCSSEPFGYSGSLAPLNGEVSFHVRGPAQLKQFAFYAHGSSLAKHPPHHGHHGHKHFHAQENGKRNVSNVAKRGVGDWVTVTMDGQVVSWINEYSGVAAPTPSATIAIPALPVAPAATGSVNHTAGAVNHAAGVANHIGAAVHHAGVPIAQSEVKPFTPSHSGDWVQAAYYNAVSGTSNGITFLNNMGGSAGSGTFDYSFGASLSYASSNGQAGAASAQTLEDITLPSDTEVILMSDKSCSAGPGCGYSRPENVAYHGFGGDSKVFLFEFSMPMDDSSDSFNANMPAIWLLNAQIPRTLQYGNAECSCWTSGCGEFDLFEILNPGNTRCKSTLHGGVSGGDSDYFDRPTGAPIKAAVVMSNSMATIKILPDNFDFSRTLTNEEVAKLGNHKSGGVSETLGTSLFKLVS